MLHRHPDDAKLTGPAISVAESGGPRPTLAFFGLFLLLRVLGIPGRLGGIDAGDVDC